MLQRMWYSFRTHRRVSVGLKSPRRLHWFDCCQSFWQLNLAQFIVDVSICESGDDHPLLLPATAGR